MSHRCYWYYAIKETKASSYNWPSSLRMVKSAESVDCHVEPTWKTAIPVASTVKFSSGSTVSSGGTLYCIVMFNGPRDPARKDTVANWGSTPSVAQRGTTILLLREMYASKVKVIWTHQFSWCYNLSGWETLTLYQPMTHRCVMVSP